VIRILELFQWEVVTGTNSELAEEVYLIAATTSAAEQREEAARPEADKKAVELETCGSLGVHKVIASLVPLPNACGLTL
jgi:hypothetical protein